MKKKITLIPCPWCGETDKGNIISRTLNGQYMIDHFDSTFRLQSSLIWDTEQEAIDEWNERIS